MVGGVLFKSELVGNENLFSLFVLALVVSSIYGLLFCSRLKQFELILVVVPGNFGVDPNMPTHIHQSHSNLQIFFNCALVPNIAFNPAFHIDSE